MAPFQPHTAIVTRAVSRMQKAAQPDQSLASPLKGFHIPAGTKMPQTQADLAVYVKSLLGQMVRKCQHYLADAWHSYTPLLPFV